MRDVERYTFHAPGQAPSYFVGYSRLMELRTDAERMLGKSFDRQSFHDYWSVWRETRLLKHVILSAAKDLKLRISRSFAVSAAQDDGGPDSSHTLHYILGQGLWPPALMRESVINGYVKPRR